MVVLRPVQEDSAGKANPASQSGGLAGEVSTNLDDSASWGDWLEPRRVLRASVSFYSSCISSDVQNNTLPRIRCARTGAIPSSPRGFGEGELPPLVWRRASPFFCRHVLQHDVVEHGFGEKLLQLCVLGLENLQPAGIRYLQPTVPRLPLVERCAANAVLAADIRRRCPRLLPASRNSLDQLK
jgi:hypothetical protein